MNKKIKKYLDEIAKTEKKIADLQQYLRGVQAALKQEEDNEMIRCIRGMKMENGQLYDLLACQTLPATAFRRSAATCGDSPCGRNQSQADTRR